jgi:hypothetical protein
MPRDNGKSKNHRGAKRFCTKGSNSLGGHERYNGNARQPPPDEASGGAREYLADRLDGARDLYLLALALGVRGDRPTLFGQMIQEARIHFTRLLSKSATSPASTRARSP